MRSPGPFVSDLFSPSKTTLDQIGGYFSDLTTPTVRLGVTGLSRAGKTVFITALVRNLIGPNRLPFFSAVSDGRLSRAYLQPQPDDDLPRFAYERHVAALTAQAPEWPQSTRRISQLRVTLEVSPRSAWAKLIGTHTMHVDIVDYPGEWLLDLGLIDVSYEAWASTVLDRMKRADHADIARDFLAAAADHGAASTFDPIAAERLASAFSHYLKAARNKPPGLATLGPGRFLMPGDLEGSPMLTFAPLPVIDQAPTGSFQCEFARRFEAYKARVVQPFFKNHFARLDRQIVLVDALAALNGGQRALEDLRSAMDAALRAFRPGSQSWLARMVGDVRIDKVLFAATKADHLPQSSHDRLQDILAALICEAQDRAQFAGADVGALAIAAVRATRETRASVGGEDLSCIKGVPLAGETMDGVVFDGHKSAAVFPGDLPDDPATAIEAADENAFTDMQFLRFMPPPLTDISTTPNPVPWPHIRLDRALDFLLSDRLP